MGQFPGGNFVKIWYFINTCLKFESKNPFEYMWHIKLRLYATLFRFYLIVFQL